METRRLGNSDLDLTVIGLGTWQFGGRWGGADDADSVAACHAALDAGVNWIDTADIYGQGRAERVVGRVVRERRDEVIVATKGGVAWEAGPGGLRIWREASGAYLRQALERSLTALGMESVDLYQVHWPVDGVAADDTFAELIRMRDEGKIRWIGVSNYHLADLEAAAGAAPITSFQVGYHVMRRQVEEAELPWCRTHGVGVLAYGPLAHGLLTGRMDESTAFPENDWRAQSELFADEHFGERIAWCGAWRRSPRSRAAPAGWRSWPWHGCSGARRSPRPSSAHAMQRRPAARRRWRGHRCPRMRRPLSTPCWPNTRRHHASTATASRRRAGPPRPALPLPGRRWRSGRPAGTDD